MKKIGGRDGIEDPDKRAFFKAVIYTGAAIGLDLAISACTPRSKPDLVAGLLASKPEPTPTPEPIPTSIAEVPRELTQMEQLELEKRAIMFERSVINFYRDLYEVIPIADSPDIVVQVVERPPEGSTLEPMLVEHSGVEYSETPIMGNRGLTRRVIYVNPSSSDYRIENSDLTYDGRLLSTFLASMSAIAPNGDRYGFEKRDGNRNSLMNQSVALMIAANYLSSVEGYNEGDLASFAMKFYRTEDLNSINNTWGFIFNCLASRYGNNQEAFSMASKDFIQSFFWSYPI